MACKVTGEPNCKCIDDTMRFTTYINPKETMRKLFTDHAVYTKFYIESALSSLPDADVLATRLLKNQDEIGEYVGLTIGADKGKIMAGALREHIMLAAKVVGYLKIGDNNKKDMAISELFKNSAKVAAFLSSLNPTALPYNTVKEMFDRHNKYVLEIATLHKSGNYSQEILTFDSYYTHMLSLSDSLSAALYL